MRLNLVKDKISEDFRLYEFVNTLDGNAVMLSVEFLNVFLPTLQEFRNWYKRPVNITSGYRTVDFNQQVHGAYNSLHLKQMAIDFALPVEYFSFPKARREQFLHNIRVKWEVLCSKRGMFGHVVLYDRHIHLGIHEAYTFFEDRRTA